MLVNSSPIHRRHSSPTHIIGQRMLPDLDQHPGKCRGSGARHRGGKRRSTAVGTRAGAGGKLGGDGGESIVDVGGPIGTFAVLAPLRDDVDAFRNVQVGEWGWSIHWSDDMELAADTLRRLALEQDVAWLRRWRASHGMTQAEAAVALGPSPRMWRSYEAGSHLLPKTVRLACIGLDAQAAAGAAA
jgi:hypothetical protein